MKHIGIMATMFDNVVSRDQVLKDRVIEYVGFKTGLGLQNRQVIIGQTIAVIQHITFAERSVITSQLDISDWVQYINNNEHSFLLQNIVVR